MMRHRVAGLLALLTALGVACDHPPTEPPPPAVASKLAFVVEPTNAVRDTTFAAPVTVRILDQNGQLLDTASNSVSLSLGVNPGHASLHGSTTVHASSGVASFSDIRLDSVGTGFRLVASSGSLTADTSAAFTVTLSLADGDGDGYSPNAGDCNDADSTTHPGAVDLPDSLHRDLDCDGLDGERANATFVRYTGADSAGCGSEAGPCLTIQKGIARAVALGKRDVYVSAGAYAGFTMADGVNVFGGFDANFGRGAGPGSNVTVTGHLIAVAGLPDSAAVTVLASGFTQGATLADLTLVGAAATGTDSAGAGRNSYVVLALNITGEYLNVFGNHILAGHGSSGAAGAPGVDADSLAADSAMNGGVGGAAKDSSVTCDTVLRGAGGTAGTPLGVSAGASRSPGTGGDGGRMDTNCNFISSDFTATPGVRGDSAAQADSAHGLGGSGGTGGNACGPAGDGAPGLVTNGGGGNGGTGAGHLSGGAWQGARGDDGLLGDNGGGGGGGGGSGGCDVGTDSWGAGGGGGGAGGVRAKQAGGGGGAGGGAFGIYLVNAFVAAIGDSIVGGVGGDGGAGGVGGQGQSGGTGGAGGAKGFDGSAGGAGGSGGHGGHGGGGGGGAGGSSYDIFVATVASQLTSLDNTFVAGVGGAGGAGGLSAPSAPVAERDGKAGGGGAAGAGGVNYFCVAPGGC